VATFPGSRSAAVFQIVQVDKRADKVVLTTGSRNYIFIYPNTTVGYLDVGTPTEMLSHGKWSYLMNPPPPMNVTRADVPHFRRLSRRLSHISIDEGDTSEEQWQMLLEMCAERTEAGGTCQLTHLAFADVAWHCGFDTCSPMGPFTNFGASQASKDPKKDPAMYEDTRYMCRLASKEIDVDANTRDATELEGDTKILKNGNSVGQSKKTSLQDGKVMVVHTRGNPLPQSVLVKLTKKCQDCIETCIDQNWVEDRPGQKAKNAEKAMGKSGKRRMLDNVIADDEEAITEDLENGASYANMMDAPPRELRHGGGCDGDSKPLLEKYLDYGKEYETIPQDYTLR